MEFWTRFPLKCRFTYGGPLGSGGVRKFSKFPRSCRRGPSQCPTTLQSPRLFYSSKNKEIKTLNFNCFKFDIKLELAGGDHGEGQLIYNFWVLRLDFPIIYLKGFNNMKFLSPTEDCKRSESWGSSPGSVRKPSNEKMEGLEVTGSSAQMSRTLETWNHSYC